MAVVSGLAIAIGTAVASGLLKSVMQKCGDAVSKSDSAAGVKSVILGGSLKPQLLDLQRELTMLDALLCAAGQSQDRGNVLVLLWVESIRMAADFADHVLEDISYDRMRRNAESNFAAKLFSGSSDGSRMFRAKTSSKLRKFMSMNAKIYEEAAKIGIKPVKFVNDRLKYQPPSAMSTDLREIREMVDTSVLVGRQADEDFIVGELCRPNNDKVLRVIAIVGMSGVGKTALARKIYDNEIVKRHYKKEMWIFVSEDFKLKRILDEMLQSLTGNQQNLSNEDAMVNKLQGCLESERYLLVLDDVWNTNKLKWDSLRSALHRIAGTGRGNTVVVTSQSNDVALAMDASITHQVNVLPTADALTLFETKALANRMQASDLREIGESIVRKCGGLPLAISTLGSLLGSMEQRSQWEEVEKSEVWDFPQGQNYIMPWLLLSYTHLPSATVQQCFAYCSVGVPRGCTTTGEYLTDQWAAQGFIQPSKTGDKGIQALGREYITSMLTIGLLQYYDDSKVELSMHDLMHDLALYVSRDTSLIIKNDDDVQKASSGVEHLMVTGQNVQLRFQEAITTLRSLIFVRSTTTISIDSVAAKARFLRRLCLVKCGLKEVPKSIGSLKQLRMLELQGNPFESLPETIGRLYNLQILSLVGCDRLVDLPQKVTKLVNLRHIVTTEAVHLPKGMGQLTCLSWLPIIKLKKADGAKIKELRSLPHLSDSVKLMQLENISSKEDAAEAGLNTKEGITHLHLNWTRSAEDENEARCDYDKEVMQGLKPHSNLEVLIVENFRGKKFSPWFSNGMHCNRLKRLHLESCGRCEQLPTLGGLPFLESLVINGMKSVEVIGSDFFYATAACSSISLFPQLRELRMSHMPKLRSWFDPSTSISTFPCLENLDIETCPFLVSVPSCFHSLKHLVIKGMISSQPLLTVLSNSHQLISLTVKVVLQLTSLSEPLLKCTSLRDIVLEKCGELVELPPTLQSLSYLEKLDVRNCGSLASLPDIGGHLTLKALLINNCNNIILRGLESCVSIKELYLIGNKLDEIPDLASLSCLRDLGLVPFSKQMSVPVWLSGLSSLSTLVIGGFNMELEHFCGINHLPTCLKSLTLYGWPKLKSLPDNLQSFTQLEKLNLTSFDGVIQLPEWLGNLSSLQTLDIYGCRSLKQLPSPASMQGLTQLRELTIASCPLLTERCSKDGGEEWHKISHLPHIMINHIRVT